MTQPKPVCVVLNPTSGGGAGLRARAEIERELKARAVDYELAFTTHAGEGVELARSFASRGARAVVAAGGDGTVHDVANGILRGAPRGACALGLIPVGTGNDFVKVVPGTALRPSAYDTIARGQALLYDVGIVRWPGGQEYFVNGMGTGIDVEVVRQLAHSPHMPGALKYLYALIRALVKYRPIALHARFDQERLDQRVMIVAVGNGICQGGGFYLAPDASPRDGVFDVCLVKEIPLYAQLRVIPRILRGTQRGDSAVFMRTATTVRLEAADERPLFFHLDGELREPAGLRSLEIEVLPGALPVWTGESSK